MKQKINLSPATKAMFSKLNFNNIGKNGFKSELIQLYKMSTDFRQAVDSIAKDYVKSFNNSFAHSEAIGKLESLARAAGYRG